MQIAQEMAGYSLGGADLLRRAMGKKKPEEMAKQRGTFADGAKGMILLCGLRPEFHGLQRKFLRLLIRLVAVARGLPRVPRGGRPSRGRLR